MRDDDPFHEPTPPNPIVSYSLHDQGDEGCAVSLAFLDPDEMEVRAEVRFDDPSAVAVTIEAALQALKVLLTAKARGFESALEVHGLIAGVEPPDLSEVDLTVDDILDARPDEP